MAVDQTTTLEEILKKWAIAFKENSNTEPNACQHEVREYTGFSEQYEFCIKCDAKKINGEWQGKSKVKNILDMF